MIQPYYQSDHCVLINADCLQVLPQLEGIDAVVTDPPYALPTLVASGRDNTTNIGDLSIPEAYFRMLLNTLESNHGQSLQVYMFCDATFYPVLFRAAYGRWSQALLVWDKGQIGMGREFRKSHELILRLWGSQTPIITDGTGHADVLKHSPVSTSQRTHPAEKPVSLIEDLLWCSGATVLDPFMGSGTTGVACVRTGRKFIGIEIDPTYAAIAEKRIREAEAQLALQI